VKKLVVVTSILVVGALGGLAIWRLTDRTTPVAEPLKPSQIAEPTARAVTVTIAFDPATCLPMGWAGDGWTIRDSNSNDIVGLGTWGGKATAPVVTFQLKASPAFYTVGNETKQLTWGPFDGSKSVALLSCENLSRSEMPWSEFYLMTATCGASHWATDVWTLRAAGSRGNGQVLSTGIVVGSYVEFANVAPPSYVVSDDTASLYWILNEPTSHSLSCAE